MNNYEHSRVVEVGPASNLIRGVKIWADFWIDSESLINWIDLWINDIDETDE
jgi:hypothetical protein